MYAHEVHFVTSRSDRKATNSNHFCVEMRARHGDCLPAIHIGHKSIWHVVWTVECGKMCIVLIRYSIFDLVCYIRSDTLSAVLSLTFHNLFLLNFRFVDIIQSVSRSLSHKIHKYRHPKLA